MNSKQRRTYSAKHIRQISAIENSFMSGMESALKKRTAMFIADVKTLGLSTAKNRMNSEIYFTEVTPVLEKLIRAVALWQAGKTYTELNKAIKKRQVQKDDTAAFGSNPGWNTAITDYLRQYLLTRAVLPITETTKAEILKVLDMGQQQGWGIERILIELQANTDELTAFRARRIIRTEIGIAANFGQKMARESVDFETDKEWIAANDHRTRDSHRKMDGEMIDSDLDFQVPLIKKGVQIGVDIMSGPGDPNGHAENVINCRCTLAYVPRRDEKGNLINRVRNLNLKL